MGRGQWTPILATAVLGLAIMLAIRQYALPAPVAPAGPAPAPAPAAGPAEPVTAGAPGDRTPAAGLAAASPVAPVATAADTTADATPRTACMDANSALASRIRDEYDPSRSVAQAATAILLAEPTDPNAAAANATASARWPGDRDLAWLHALRCGQGCDRGAALERLQRLDPDNAAVWQMSMEHASRIGDDAAFADALDRAVRAADYRSPAGLATAAGTAPMASMLQRGRHHGALLQTIATCDTGHPNHGMASYATLIGFLAFNAERAAVLSPTEAFKPCLPADGRGPRRHAHACSVALRRAARDEPTVQGRMFIVQQLIELEPSAPDLPDQREALRVLAWLDERPAMPKPWPSPFPAIQARVDDAIVDARRSGDWPPPEDWLPENIPLRSQVLGELEH